MESGRSRYPIARTALIVAALAGLLVVPTLLRRPGPMPSLPAPDLRRLTFPTAGLTVSEHGPKALQVATDEWMVSVIPMSSEHAANVMGALRGVVARSPECREDVLEARGSPTIHRFLRGVQGSHHAAQADYVISFGDGWASARGYPRDPVDRFDVTPFDRLLLALRLGDRPRPECEVPPAWRAYQARRRPGSPLAKYVLYMDPAPVRLGDYQAGLRDRTVFTPVDFRRGGRQITPDVIEFYAQEDRPSIRVDIWLDGRPDVEGQQAVFEARLHVAGTPISLWSFVEPYDVPVPPGDYDVSIALLHRGNQSERTMTDAERFDRDDLERYEIVLSRRR